MGYRRLFKNYLKHVNSLLGTTLVETTGASKVFSKRDLGEMSAMAAELDRETLAQRGKPPSDRPAADYDPGELLSHLLRGLNLTRQEAADALRVDVDTINRWCSPADEQQRGEDDAIADRAYFTHVVCQLIRYHQLNQVADEPEDELVEPGKSELPQTNSLAPPPQ